MRRMQLTVVLLIAFALTAAPQPPAKPSAMAEPKAAAKATTTTAPAGVVDINSATPEQLNALPGIGKVYGDKIVKNRPYRAKNELVGRNIIPPAIYAKIQGRIIARQK